MSKSMSHFKGKLISIDGIDGSGKTTQTRLLADKFRTIGLPVVALREPGGSNPQGVGEKIRELLLHTDYEMDSRCEAMLFMAARAQLHVNEIEPALSEGKIVLTDRWAWSTLAYQAQTDDELTDLLDVAEYATRGRFPDLTIILDLDQGEAIKRLSGTKDRFEKRGVDFFAGVRRHYKQIVENYENVIEIPATGKIEIVHDLIWTLLENTSEVFVND